MTYGRPNTSQVLTPRQRGVLALLANGYRRKEIAQALGISVDTVETHMAAIKRKYGPETSTRLVTMALQRRELILEGV